MQSTNRKKENNAPLLFALYSLRGVRSGLRVSDSPCSALVTALASTTSDTIRHAHQIRMTPYVTEWNHTTGVQSNIVGAARIGLHNCITFRNKSLTNSNKLLHVVTLRHNNYRKKQKRTLRISENTIFTNDDDMNNVIGALQWKLPRAPVPFIRPWLTPLLNHILFVICFYEILASAQLLPGHAQQPTLIFWPFLYV